MTWPTRILVVWTLLWLGACAGMYMSSCEYKTGPYADEHDPRCLTMQAIGARNVDGR